MTVMSTTYYCEKCGEGLMKYTETCLDSDPAKYEHKCVNCGHIAYYDMIGANKIWWMVVEQRDKTIKEE